MAYEIELKAWVDDPSAMETLLLEVGRFIGPYDKRDSYFTLPGGIESPKRTLRLRQEKSGVTVTMKQKKVIAGIEQNLEEEFTVSSFDSMKNMLESLGCRCYIEKRKTGKKYLAGNLVLELSNIENLGWFLEIEKLEESEDAETVEQAREEILSMLAKLGIEQEKIESRFYTDMLQGKS